MAADPAQLLDLAAVCGRGAETLHSASTAVTRATADIHWQGPGAERFRIRLAEQQQTAVRLGERLLFIKAELSRHAEWIEVRHAELRRVEARVRAWAAAHPPNPAVPGPDSSLIGPYPPPLDARWDDLAARLRAAGATF